MKIKLSEKFFIDEDDNSIKLKAHKTKRQPEHNEKLVLYDGKSKVEMYAIDSVNDMIRYGKGTEWFVAGRHGTEGKIDTKQANEYFNRAKEQSLDACFYVLLTPETKYCIIQSKNGNILIKDKQDNKVKFSDISNLSNKLDAFFNYRIEKSKEKFVWDGKSEIPENAIDIIVSDGIEILPHDTFLNNTKLKSIVLPKTLKRIEEIAFKGCINLESVKLPNNLESIGDLAFNGCEHLNSLTLPDNIGLFGVNAFPVTTTIYLNPDTKTDNRLWNGYKKEYLKTSRWSSEEYIYNPSVEHEVPKNVVNVRVQDGLVKIPENAFALRNSLEKIILPETLTEIGESAFWECDKLREVSIPKSVKSIGRDAFYECKSLNSINFNPDNCSVGDDAFYDCGTQSDNGVVIDFNGDNISQGAFKFSKIAKITFSENIKKIGKDAFMYAEIQDFTCKKGTCAEEWVISNEPRTSHTQIQVIHVS